MTYDALNRLLGKTYSSGNMTNIVYAYDAYEEDVNYGKGQRASMTDASGNTTYTYDLRGRLIEEVKTVVSDNGTYVYTTKFGYDSADRLLWTLYSSSENVTQTYNARGLPDTLTRVGAGSLVTNTFYNALGSVTEINLGNGLKTTYGYYGTGGAYDTTGGYYGRLWEIKTQKSPNTPLQQVQHTWDANGNLISRFDAMSSENETFTYDFLDRLTGVTGPYSDSWTYTTIGNIDTHGGVSYDYGSDGIRPHAVRSFNGVSYLYDDNGNMYQRGSQNVTWDAENRPVIISEGGETIATFIYDGDGNRVMKIEGGETVLYINQYFEVNLSTSTNTSYYYLGGRLTAMSENSTLSYVHQDHLTGTSLMTDANGNQIDTTMRYYPYGGTRAGSVPTDRLFTGQRLDGTGLYFYGARYYDPTIGRFISADTLVPDPANPQSFNRYTYCLNNPLRYTDPSGQTVYAGGMNVDFIYNIMENYGDWAQCYIEYYLNTSEFQAYDFFKQQLTERANYLEDLNESVYIEYGDIGYPIDSKYEEINGEHHIILNNGEEKDISRNGYHIQAAAISDCSYKIKPVFTEYELKIMWTTVKIGGGILATALSIYGMGYFVGGYVVGGLTEAIGGGVLSGGYNIFTGIIYTGISYKVYVKGIEMASLGQFNLSTNFWWPSPPYLQP